MDHAWRAYREGTVGEMQGLLDIITLWDTPNLLRDFNSGTLSRQEALRLHRRLVGTGAPGDPEHVQLGLLNMNIGNQLRTFRQLTHAPHTDEKLANLRLMCEHTTLASLFLSGNQISDAGVQALAGNTTLRSLNLSFNQIGDAGAQALAGNTTLTSLDLTENYIGDAGAQALAGNTTLTSLDLSCNLVGDAGALALAGNTTLKFLSLMHNDIGEAGAQALAGNTTLGGDSPV